METKEIAEKLVEWCNQGDYEKPYQELYGPNIVSIENDGKKGKMLTSKVLRVFRKKGNGGKKISRYIVVQLHSLSLPIIGFQ